MPLVDIEEQKLRRRILELARGAMFAGAGGWSTAGWGASRRVV